MPTHWAEESRGRSCHGTGRRRTASTARGVLVAAMLAIAGLTMIVTAGQTAARGAADRVDLRIPAQAAQATGACCPGTTAPCPADLNGDELVNVLDLLLLLEQWGPCSNPDDCPADLNGDELVNVLDLLLLLESWGPCPDGGGACEVTSTEACESLGGYALTPGTTCEDCPNPVMCPDDAIDESESCGESTNDGCLLDPPTYGEMLTCGDSACGTAFAIDGTRDQDWYRISITEDTKVTWSVEAPFPVEVHILTLACPSAIAAQSSGQNPTAEACLPPGEYVLRVRPEMMEGLSCDSGLNGYVATVSCDSCSAPTGACCTPENNACDEVPLFTCLALDPDAEYLGDGSTCDQVDCPFGPPLGLCKGNCGKAAIPDGMGGFCDCEDKCEAFDSCCPGHCDDCPELDSCDPTTPCEGATGDCCNANETPGCQDADCCSAVCSCDVFCCDGPWDALCASGGECSAEALCPQCQDSECPTVSCTNNEGEPCGEAINDGCSADQDNPPYGSIACGETICGNLWAASSPEFPDGARDTDWFLLDLTGAESTVELVWSVQASHPVDIFVLTATCPAQEIEQPVSGCSGSITTQCLDPGQYVVLVQPSAFDGLPCPGFTYEATLTCNTEKCPDVTNECEDLCGGPAPSGCFCDDSCVIFDDCCPNICEDCPEVFCCPPDGPGCH